VLGKPIRYAEAALLQWMKSRQDRVRNPVVMVHHYT
jgi:hypothetical protein